MTDRAAMIFYPPAELRERIERYANTTDLSLSKSIIVMLIHELDRWEASQLVAHE